MAFKNKLSLGLICAAAMCSGAASAAEVGRGTINIAGTIGPATCTVAPSKTSITVPHLTPAVIVNASLAAELYKDTFNFDFANCGNIGNTFEFEVTRNVAPPTGTGGANYSGGFTYSGGNATDIATGPVFYKVDGPNGALPMVTGITAPSKTVDISGITDKSSFSLPMAITVHKAPANSVHPAEYNGNFSASLAWSITYP
ncbi:hypothetical protein [Enterobacter cloacae complex sp. 280C5]|uniref:hypothetical protein n=1 Tax=Enterobacter cloacae complex TaxID=354276 RepID=UPI003CF970FD